MSPPPGRLHALLVGIDRYLPPPDGGEGPFPDLGGCLHDVARIDAFLRRSVAPEAEVEIETLVSGAGTPAPPHRLPTCANLLAALDRLEERAAPGEQVLLFYAGHGTRLRTAFPELKGNRGHDEALVPCDAAHPEAPLVLDVHLAHWLRRLTEREVFVTLILDSCHAGGATRQARGVAVRCAEALFGTRRPPAAGFATAGELAESWERWRGSADRHLHSETTSGWLPRPEGYVLLAACGAYQRAHEIRPNGKGSGGSEDAPRGGALTHHLLAALEQPAVGEWSWSRLHTRVLAGVHGHFHDQTPVLEGAAERRPFGGAVTPLPPAIAVLKRDDGQGRLLLAAGRGQGVGEGARLALHAPDATDLGDPGTRLALAEVVNAGPDRAWARLLEVPTQDGRNPDGRNPGGRNTGAVTSSLPPAARAVVVDPGRALATAVAPCTVDLDADGRELLAAVGEAVRRSQDGPGGGFLRWLDGEGSGAVLDLLPDLQVAVLPGGDAPAHFAVLDRAGSEILLRPHLPAAAASVRPLVRRLSHLARYRRIERLENPDPYSSLAGRVRVELHRRLPNPGGDGEERRPVPRPGGVHRVGDGWRIAVEVHNDSRQELHTALFVLQTDRGVTQLWPNPLEAGSRLMEPGTHVTVCLRAQLPRGYSRGRDVLKVLAATGDTDYRWLQLPALDVPPPGPDRGFRARSALEHLLVSLTSGHHASDRLARDRGHAADLTLAAAHGWTTVQVPTVVERRPAGG